MAHSLGSEPPQFARESDQGHRSCSALPLTRTANWKAWGPERVDLRPVRPCEGPEPVRLLWGRSWGLWASTRVCAVACLLSGLGRGPRTAQGGSQEGQPRLGKGQRTGQFQLEGPLEMLLSNLFIVLKGKLRAKE